MNWRTPRSVAPLLLTVLLPLEVEIPGATSDSASVRPEDPTDPDYEFDFAAGTGRFAMVPRSCSPQPDPLPVFEVRNRDAAVGVTRRFPNDVVLGVRGGYIHDEIVESDQDSIPDDPDREIVYLNPWIGVETHWFGLRGGGVLSTEKFPVKDGDEERIPFSAGVRLGPPSIYGFISVMESMPLQSGGGYIRMGVGTGKPDRFDVWAAVAGEPHDESGLAVGADVRVTPRVSVLGRVRLGESEGVDENSIAAGLRFHSRPPK